jgi:hypothetical protein
MFLKSGIGVCKDIDQHTNKGTTNFIYIIVRLHVSTLLGHHQGFIEY